jgi:hypothetical protein
MALAVLRGKSFSQKMKAEKDAAQLTEQARHLHLTG